MEVSSLTWFGGHHMKPKDSYTERKSPTRYDMYFNIDNGGNCEVPIILHLSTIYEQHGSLSFSALVVLLMHGVNAV